ncbi:tubulin polyglutamylase TTLL7 [Octopus bimaculoides]|uniref:Tubulin--tyrosine ligase-like protein 9 n=1 Tax=Octopus bimaculoides TaxID=37653 RepID=A0A0L8FYG9_OCTBM|nr:tubulin polyglutamylase TTLL7 [Octopus bimaculoides]|eukprot:XP_014785724.1 PREDICTED: tubulin polyglutamylase TTLL7-like [Octopus bimaculoides]
MMPVYMTMSIEKATGNECFDIVMNGVTAENYKEREKQNKRAVSANISGTRFKLVKKVLDNLNFSITEDEDFTSYLIWSDAYVSNEKVSDLQNYQRINHFPGMIKITRKDYLARNFVKMQKMYRDAFSFHPRTWVMPSELSELSQRPRCHEMKQETQIYIAKPFNGSQGHGIYLCNSIEKIHFGENAIVQEYIHKPLLINNVKFDLRLYVLITTCDPLRVFVYKEGLVRLSTENYLPPADDNLENLFMHLTNYSINKRNNSYEKSTSPKYGIKRSFKYLNQYLRQNDYDVTQLWQQIYDLIAKTMIMAEPHLLHAYRNCRPGAQPGSASVCFEILGFDVLVDSNLKPWLLEVNRSPSLNTDHNIDLDVKTRLLEDTITLLHIKISDKTRTLAAQKAEAQKRLFSKVGRNAKFDINGKVSQSKLVATKRKMELKNLLNRLQTNASQEIYENENCGGFFRIFPSDDKLQQQKYSTWMAYAFSVFKNDIKSSMTKGKHYDFSYLWQEDEILNMLAECEAAEMKKTFKETNYPSRGTCL